jgi:hypothetical protein
MNAERPRDTAVRDERHPERVMVARATRQDRGEFVLGLVALEDDESRTRDECLDRIRKRPEQAFGRLLGEEPRENVRDASVRSQLDVVVPYTFGFTHVTAVARLPLESRADPFPA